MRKTGNIGVLSGQKLNDIYTKPLQEHWSLSKTPEAYPFSSASFYTTAADESGFLINIMDVF